MYMHENNNFEEKNELKSKNKNKKKSGIIILIVCLVLIIVGLVTYIFYDKGIIFNNTNTTTEKTDKD